MKIQYNALRTCHDFTFTSVLFRFYVEDHFILNSNFCTNMASNHKKETFMQQTMDIANCVEASGLREDLIEQALELYQFHFLTTCNAMNVQDMREVIRVLKLFAPCRSFHVKSLAVRATVDFVLTSVAFFTRSEWEDGDAILADLLSLLEIVINRNEEFGVTENLIDKTRISDVILGLMRSPQNVNAKICASRIVGQLLTGGVNDLAINVVLKATFDELKRLNTFYDLCALADISLRGRFISHETTGINYIISNYSNYIAKGVKPEQCLHIIRCINTIYTLASPDGLFRSIYKYLDTISEYCCCPSVGAEMRAFLIHVLLDYCISNNIPWIDSSMTIQSSVFALPDQTRCWVSSDNDIFFLVAYLQFLYSNILWEEKQILRSLTRRVNQPHFIPLPILRAMLFLYCVSIKHFNPASIQATGNILLQRVENCGTSAETVFTCHITQLWWILSKGSSTLKMKTILTWLNYGENRNVLLNAIKMFGVQRELLEFILVYPQEGDCKKISELIVELGDRIISRGVTGALLHNFHRLDVFSHLVCAKPALPTVYQEGLQLCTVMGAILPSLHDREVFQGACKFSTKLLQWLKNYPAAMTDFCQNMANIRVLFTAAASEDDDTALSVIELLITLVKFQGFNHLTFEHRIQDDFSSVIKGSQQRLSGALRLLDSILRSQNRIKPFIDINGEHGFGLHQKLLEVSRDERAGELIFVCLERMIRKHRAFAAATVTQILVEMQCQYPVALTFSKSFVSFLKVWLEIMEPISLIPFPKERVRNYMLRAPPKLKVEQSLESYLNS